CQLLFLLWVVRLQRSQLVPYTTLFRCMGRVHVHQDGEKPGDKGVDIKGDTLKLRRLGPVGCDKLEVYGDTAPAGPRRLSLSVSPDRKSTRLNSSHLGISYAVFCLKNKN